MSWKANMQSEYTYFPKAYPFGPATTKNTTIVNPNPSTPTSKSSVKKNDASSSKNLRPPRSAETQIQTTTMTGLPWAVRAKLEGKAVPEPPRRQGSPPPRLANYTFTYGLSKEDAEQIRSEVPSRFGFSVTSFRMSPGVEASQLSNVNLRSQTTPPSRSGIISDRLKSMKDSFHKAAQSSTANIPKPYFRNWGNSKSEVIAGQGLDSDDSEMILHSTQNILNQTGMHEGLKSYFEGLDQMDHYNGAHDENALPMIDLEVAAAAFQPPAPKPSRLQPKTYYEVGQRPNVSRLSLLKNRSISRPNASVVSEVGPVSKKVSTKKVRMAEPDPGIFIKTPALKPSHQEKVIEKQLQKEVAKSPMTHEQYSTRKQELLQAALQTYDRDVPTYEVIPDIRDEIIAAEEHYKDLSRQNVMDLLYNALTNQSTTLTMKSPSTGLNLSSAHLANRDKAATISRPSDQFKGPVVSTILRELQETKDSGTIQSQEFTPNISSTKKPNRRVPIRKESKEKLKALRALENYDLSKLRQRNSLAPKPVLTLLSVKKVEGQGLSRTHYSGISGGTSVSKQRTHIGGTADVATATSGPGSFTALSSLQTRNDRYTLGKRMRPIRAISTRTRNPKPLLGVGTNATSRRN